MFMCIRFEDSLLTCCCSISDWGKEKNWSGGGGGGGGERPPARKLAFSSSPSAGGREILIGSLTVNVNQNLSAESFSHDGRLAMLWKNVYLCIFRFCEMQMVLFRLRTKIAQFDCRGAISRVRLFGSGINLSRDRVKYISL